MYDLAKQSSVEAKGQRYWNATKPCSPNTVDVQTNTTSSLAPLIKSSFIQTWKQELSCAFGVPALKSVGEA
jgi:hypothetical protein